MDLKKDEKKRGRTKNNRGKSRSTILKPLREKKMEPWVITFENPSKGKQVR